MHAATPLADNALASSPRTMNSEWRALKALAEDDSLPATTAFIQPGQEAELLGELVVRPAEAQHAQHQHQHQPSLAWGAAHSNHLSASSDVYHASHQEPLSGPQAGGFDIAEGQPALATSLARHPVRARHAMESSIQYAAAMAQEHDQDAEADHFRLHRGSGHPPLVQPSGQTTARDIQSAAAAAGSPAHMEAHTFKEPRWPQSPADQWPQAPAGQQPYSAVHQPADFRAYNASSAAPPPSAQPLQHRQPQLNESQRHQAWRNEAEQYARTGAGPPRDLYEQGVGTRQRISQDPYMMPAPGGPTQYGHHVSSPPMQRPTYAFSPATLHQSPIPESTCPAEPPPAMPRSGSPARQAGKGHPTEDAGVSELDYCRAVISHLERAQGELQRRMQQLQDALQDTDRKQAASDETYKEQLKQAEAKVQQREQQLVLVQRHADTATHDLRSCQQELQREREKVEAGRDQVVRLQEDCRDLVKQLDLANRKISHLGEEERRMQAAVMQLRKENQEMQEAVGRTRADMADMRARLASAQAEIGRQQQAASHASAEAGGAVAQLHALKAKVADLEAKNRELMGARGRNNSPAFPTSSGSPGNQLDMPDYAAAASYLSDTYGAPPAPIIAGNRRNAANSAPVARSGAAAGLPAPGNRGESVKSLLYNGGTGAASSANASASVSSPYGVGGGGRLPAGDQPTWYQPSQGAPQRPLDGPPAREGMAGGDYGRQWSPGAPMAPVRAWEEPQAAASSCGQHYAPPPDPWLPLPDMPGAGGREGPGYGGGAANAYRGYAPPGQAPLGPGPTGGLHAKHEHLKRSIEERLASLQTAEDEIKSRLAAQDLLYSKRPQAASESYLQQPGQGWDANAQQHSYSAFTSGGQGQQAWSGDARGYDPSTGAADRGVSGQAHPQADPPSKPSLTPKEMLDRSKQLEDSLVARCWEKAQLDAELSKMPAGSGRNLKERRRKVEVEQRMDVLNKEISGLRMELKQYMLK